MASTSGDGTVKVWNLSQSTATFTLSDHRQPGATYYYQTNCNVCLIEVWKCSWNWSGQILGSAGMDHCCRLWDVDRYIAIYLFIFYLLLLVVIVCLH